MPAFIVIDAYTGYIWGDSRDFAPGLGADASPIDACRLLDEGIGNHGRSYEQVPGLSGDTGYFVYRADINGSEAVPVIQDGQSRDEIAAVIASCRLVGFVEYCDSAD